MLPAADRRQYGSWTTLLDTKPFVGEGFCETIRKRAPNVLALLHEVIADRPSAVAAQNPLAL